LCRARHSSAGGVPSRFMAYVVGKRPGTAEWS
jgi:hypothetical protein